MSFNDFGYKKLNKLDLIILNNPILQKFYSVEDFLNSNINKSNLTYTQILVHSVKLFFEFCFLKIEKGEKILDLISKICNKTKQLDFFNLLISYYEIIKITLNNISKDVQNNFLNNELEVKPIFSFINEKNEIFDNYDDSNKINENFKILKFKINFTVTNETNYYYFMKKIEFNLNYKENDDFVYYDLTRAPFPIGYTLQNHLKNEKLVLKNFKGDFSDYTNLDEINKGEKIYLIRDNIIKDEIKIKENFKLTKRNSKGFKQTYKNFELFLKSNEKIMNNISFIYPFGSVIQFTQNISSDLEITLITKNYQSISSEEKDMFLENVINYIKEKDDLYENVKKLTTKRTILINCIDKKTNIKIEINLNNFFGIYNGNLIRNYLLIDSRALILVNTIKDWSKRKGINGNIRGHLSSYCYTLMTIYFLQRLDPPILPVISSKNDLIKTTIENKEYYLEKKLISKDIIKYKSENNDSIATLFIKWLIFYLYLFKEEYYCIDITRKKQLKRSYEMKYMNYFETNNKLIVYIFIDMFDYTYNPGAYFERNSTPHINMIKIMKSTLKQCLEGNDNIIQNDEININK